MLEIDEAQAMSDSRTAWKAHTIKCNPQLFTPKEVEVAYDVLWEIRWELREDMRLGKIDPESAQLIYLGFYADRDHIQSPLFAALN